MTRWGVVLPIYRPGVTRLLVEPYMFAPGTLHRTIDGWRRPADLPEVTRAMPLAIGLALRWDGVLDPWGWDRARRVYVAGAPDHGLSVPDAWDFDPDDRALLAVAEGLRVRGLVGRAEVYDHRPE